MADESGGSSGGMNLGGLDLVTIGALVVLASWVIFDLITDDYGPAFVGTVVALIIVALPRIDASAITDIAPMSSFLKAGGYALALIGAIDILTDLENSIFDAGGATILGALIAWVGYVVAFVGARQA